MECPVPVFPKKRSPKLPHQHSRSRLGSFNNDYQNKRQKLIEQAETSHSGSDTDCISYRGLKTTLW